MHRKKSTKGPYIRKVLVKIEVSIGAWTIIHIVSLLFLGGLLFYIGFKLHSSLFEEIGYLFLVISAVEIPSDILTRQALLRDIRQALEEARKREKYRKIGIIGAYEKRAEALRKIIPKIAEDIRKGDIKRMDFLGHTHRTWFLDDTFKSALENMEMPEEKWRVIMLSPDSAITKQIMDQEYQGRRFIGKIKERDFETFLKERYYHIELVLNSLKDYKDKVEVKVINDMIVYTDIAIVSYKDGREIIYASPYSGYRSGVDSPLFVIEKVKENDDLFDLYKNEFEFMWKKGKIIE
jgi:hypothetical protein